MPATLLAVVLMLAASEPASGSVPAEAGWISPPAVLGGRSAGMARLFAAEVAHRPGWSAVRIRGGHGHGREHPVNRSWRDSGLLPVGGGTREIRREVNARRILQER